MTAPARRGIFSFSALFYSCGDDGNRDMEGHLQLLSPSSSGGDDGTGVAEGEPQQLFSPAFNSGGDNAGHMEGSFSFSALFLFKASGGDYAGMIMKGQLQLFSSPLFFMLRRQ
eukprot:jgi/Tetstr1/457787/TSEL_044332.t1